MHGRDPYRHREHASSKRATCGAWEISIDESSAAADRAIDAMRAGVDAGMTWIDTAEMYGIGRSEELVSRALEDRPDVLVFTKVWHGVRGTLTSEVVRAAAEASLERLGRDAIDLYLLLEADPTWALEDTWESVAALADEGLVRSRLVQPHRRACRPLRASAPRRRRAESVLAHPPKRARGAQLALRHFGTTFIAYGPLAYVGRLQAVANRAGLPLAQVAPAWVTLRDEFTVAIAGSTSADTTRANAAAGSVQVVPSAMDELDALGAP